MRKMPFASCVLATRSREFVFIRPSTRGVFSSKVLTRVIDVVYGCSEERCENFKVCKHRLRFTRRQKINKKRRRLAQCALSVSSS